MKKDRRRAALALGLLCFALAPLGLAAPNAPGAPNAGGVDVKLTAFRVTIRDGKDVLSPAEKAKPGDTLEYQAVYANTGDKAARGVAATLPIPTALEYLPGSATPEGALASTDGKTFAPPPLKRVSKTADGGTKIVIVPAGEYRFLRWNLGDLAAGKSAQVSARARVLTVAKGAR